MMTVLWVVPPCTGRSRFTPGLHTGKTWCKSSTKFPFKTLYLLALRGLTASSCIVYDYTSSGHMDGPVEDVPYLCECKTRVFLEFGT